MKVYSSMTTTPPEMGMAKATRPKGEARKLETSLVL
jgi:hypothetical protein